MASYTLELESRLPQEEWGALVSAANALKGRGYEWEARAPERIRVCWVEPDPPSARTQEIAQFLFHEGRVYLHLEELEGRRAPPSPPGEVESLEGEQEKIARARWSELLQAAGLVGTGGSRSLQVAGEP